MKTFEEFLSSLNEISTSHSVGEASPVNSLKSYLDQSAQQNPELAGALEKFSTSLAVISHFSTQLAQQKEAMPNATFSEKQTQILKKAFQTMTGFSAFLQESAGPASPENHYQILNKAGNGLDKALEQYQMLFDPELSVQALNPDDPTVEHPEMAEQEPQQEPEFTQAELDFIHQVVSKGWKFTPDELAKLHALKESLPQADPEKSSPAQDDFRRIMDDLAEGRLSSDPEHPVLQNAKYASYLTFTAVEQIMPVFGTLPKDNKLAQEVCKMMEDKSAALAESAADQKEQLETGMSRQELDAKKANEEAARKQEKFNRNKLKTDLLRICNAIEDSRNFKNREAGMLATGDMQKPIVSYVIDKTWNQLTDLLDEDKGKKTDDPAVFADFTKQATGLLRNFKMEVLRIKPEDRTPNQLKAAAMVDDFFDKVMTKEEREAQLLEEESLRRKKFPTETEKAVDNFRKASDILYSLERHEIPQPDYKQLAAEMIRLKEAEKNGTATKNEKDTLNYINIEAKKLSKENMFLDREIDIRSKCIQPMLKDVATAKLIHQEMAEAMPRERMPEECRKMDEALEALSNITVNSKISDYCSALNNIVDAYYKSFLDDDLSFKNSRTIMRMIDSFVKPLENRADYISGKSVSHAPIRVDTNKTFAQELDQVKAVERIFSDYQGEQDILNIVDTSIKDASAWASEQLNKSKIKKLGSSPAATALKEALQDIANADENSVPMELADKMLTVSASAQVLKIYSLDAETSAHTTALLKSLAMRDVSKSLEYNKQMIEKGGNYFDPAPEVKEKNIQQDGIAKEEPIPEQEKAENKAENPPVEEKKEEKAPVIGNEPNNDNIIINEPKNGNIINEPENDGSVYDKNFASLAQGVFTESKDWYTAAHINSQEIRNLRNAVNNVKTAQDEQDPEQYKKAMIEAYKASVTYIEKITKDHENEPDWKPSSIMGQERLKSALNIAKVIKEKYPEEAAEFDKTLMAERAARFKPTEMIKQGITGVQNTIRTVANDDFIRESKENPKKAKEELKEYLAGIIGFYAVGKDAQKKQNGANNAMQPENPLVTISDEVKDSITKREDFKRMIERNSVKKLTEMALSKNGNLLVNELAKQSKLLKKEKKEQELAQNRNTHPEKTAKKQKQP